MRLADEKRRKRFRCQSRSTSRRSSGTTDRLDAQRLRSAFVQCTLIVLWRLMTRDIPAVASGAVGLMRAPHRSQRHRNSDEDDENDREQPENDPAVIDMRVHVWSSGARRPIATARIATIVGRSLTYCGRYLPSDNTYRTRSPSRGVAIKSLLLFAPVAISTVSPAMPHAVPVTLPPTSSGQGA